MCCAAGRAPLLRALHHVLTSCRPGVHGRELLERHLASRRPAGPASSCRCRAGRRGSSSAGCPSSSAVRSAEPSPSRCPWPVNSPIDAGRIRTASGASAAGTGVRLPGPGWSSGPNRVSTGRFCRTGPAARTRRWLGFRNACLLRRRDRSDRAAAAADARGGRPRGHGDDERARAHGVARGSGGEGRGLRRLRRRCVARGRGGGAARGGHAPAHEAARTDRPAQARGGVGAERPDPPRGHSQPRGGRRGRRGEARGGAEHRLHHDAGRRRGGRGQPGCIARPGSLGSVGPRGAGPGGGRDRLVDRGGGPALRLLLRPGQFLRAGWRSCRGGQEAPLPDHRRRLRRIPVHPRR